MNKALIIARREFVAMTTRKAYIFAVIGVPAFVGGLVAILVLTAGMSEQSDVASKPIAVVDQAGVFQFRPMQPARDNEMDVPGVLFTMQAGNPNEIVRYDDQERAVADVREGKLSVCYVIPKDYLESGQLTAYSREGGVFSAFRTPGLSRLEDRLRASLVRTHVSDEAAVRRVVRPFERIDRRTVLPASASTGGGAPAGGGTGAEVSAIDSLVGSFGVFFLFSMAIFFSSGYLLQGAVEDRHSRLMEVLLSSVSPAQLLAGKLIGLGGAGLVQVIVYGAIVVAPAMMAVPLYRPSLGAVALSVMYFLLGYVLIATLMAGTGMLGGSVYESGQLSVIWTLTSAIPLMLLGPISGAPNGLLARSLSFFPLTAPLAMLLRIGLGSKPFLDIALSTLSLCVGIYLAVRATSVIFRMQSFMYGKRPTLREMTHWFREA